MVEDSKEYWQNYGSVIHHLMHHDDDGSYGEAKGFIFPGRNHYRKDLVFDVTEKFECQKQYVKSKRFTPGILTVQCCCDRPQLIGYIVMVRAESTALALTSVLTNFGIPPRVVYYDNGCNLVKSILTRAPWLLHVSKFVVDRFHFKSHTCSEIFDPDAYHLMDTDVTTTAESINARLEKTVPYLRYVSGENFIPYLNIRFALLNIATRYRKMHQIEDLEDEDLWKYFKEVVECECWSCSTISVTRIDERDEHEYQVNFSDHQVDTVAPASEDSESDGEVPGVIVSDQVHVDNTDS